MVSTLLLLLFLAPTSACLERALLNPVTLMYFAPSVTNAVGILSLQGSPGELLWLESVHRTRGRGRGPEHWPPTSKGELHVECQLLSLPVPMQHQLSIVFIMLLFVYIILPWYWFIGLKVVVGGV